MLVSSQIEHLLEYVGWLNPLKKKYFTILNNTTDEYYAAYFKKRRPILFNKHLNW